MIKHPGSDSSNTGKEIRKIEHLQPNPIHSSVKGKCWKHNQKLSNCVDPVYALLCLLLILIWFSLYIHIMLERPGTISRLSQRGICAKSAPFSCQILTPIPKRNPYLNVKCSLSSKGSFSAKYFSDLKFLLLTS